MGLGNSTNKIYLQVADGKIIRRTTEDNPNAKSRTNKDGKIVWEEKYSFICGILKGINIKEKQIIGATDIKNWVLDIEDEGNQYQLEVMYDSRYAVTLMNALCNPVVDFSKPINISPWMKEIDGKKKTAIYLHQGQENVDWYFTKENPRGMPEWKQVQVKGKVVWDNYESMQFLEEFINREVKPRLGVEMYNDEPQGDTKTILPGYGKDNAPDEDDLPF